MKIVEFSIQDTFGTKNIHFRPRSVTRISGPNASGKSSILRGLMKCFEGGSDPSVIRNGAEKSVVEFSLSDGTRVTRTTAPVKRRRGEDPTTPVRYSTALEILQPDGTPRAAPQTYLNDLCNATAVDPGKILRIDATTAPGRKALAEILLAIMPIKFGVEEIAAKLAADYRDGSEVAKLDVAGLALPAIERELDLDGLKKYTALVTEQRRRLGQTRDDADGAVNRGRQSLPEDDGKDYVAALKEAEDFEKSVIGAVNEQKLDIERQKGEALTNATATHSQACAEIDREISAKIMELERERAYRKDVAQQQLDGAKKVVAQAEAEALQTLAAQSAPELQRAATDIGLYKERVAGQSRAKFIREQIEDNLGVYRTADRKYRQLTEVIARLDQLRKDKLDSLPVPGLEVSGDQVLVDNVAWQNQNTAKRVWVSVQLCTQLGDPGPIFLDDAEHLDTETRLMLEDGLVAAGFQLFEAMVSNADTLTIETFDPAVAA